MHILQPRHTMGDNAKFFLLLFLELVSLGFTRGGVNNCQSPQYLDIGTRGTIQCNFLNDYLGIFWYNSTNHYGTRPIISIASSRKEGKGYDSGEFDVYPNGSLIINNVTLQHDHFFSVTIVHTTDEKPISFEVLVVVTVKPAQKHPIIKQCERHQRICTRSEAQSVTLECYVNDARPAVHLIWAIKTMYGDKELFYNTSFTMRSSLFSSTINTTFTPNSANRYVAFACIAKSSPSLLTFDESLTLVQINDFERSPLQTTPVRTFVHHNEVLSLVCTNESSLYLTWEKVVNMQPLILEPLIDTVFDEKLHAFIRKHGFKTRNDSALVLSKLQPKDEGLYVCTFGDGLIEHVKTYNVTMYVIPKPPYPVVDGCSEDRYCVLPVSRNGTLTCTLRGIRPPVELEWRAFRESEASEISFSTHKYSVISNEGGTFNVILKSVFLLIGSRERLTVECKSLPNEVVDQFGSLRTRLDLLAKDTHEVSTYRIRAEDGKNDTRFKVSDVHILIAVVILIFITALVVTARTCKTRRKVQRTRGRNGNNQEEILLRQLQRDKEEFQTNLKQSYMKSQIYTQPIPYRQNKWYSIERCFVKPGVEYLRHGLQGTESWERVDSYHDILKADHSRSKRVIVEAEPGYGKSTLCVQLSKDWCDQNPSSPLHNVDILILIRLRNFNGGRLELSVYEAIKELLLPANSTISVQTIEALLERYSTVILLDGFDNYPLHNRTDIQIDEIMQGNILQSCLVILTTRLSCVRKDYPVTAERFRLRGFDASIRSEYIQKVITHSINETNKIEEIISTHPFLQDLCQVPLIFAHFAHMVKTGAFGTSVQINTVTSIFQNIMTCFYHNMHYKGVRNVFENATFEYDHSKLDELAFEGLKRSQTSWPKKDMRNHLGDESYARYLNSGILVEEVRTTSDERGSLITVTKVRFYHKLFCEWFASNHLAKNASTSTYDDLKIQLENINPTDLQYVYRIACGLNETAASMIMQHVQKIEDGRQFEILCILEQPRKEDFFNDRLTNLCSARVTIDVHDSRLLQRSTVQLLKIAASQEIQIKELWLNDMNGVVDLSTKRIQLRENLYLPNLESLQRLSIVDTDRELSLKDLGDILKYSTFCNSLISVRFEKCLLPRIVDKTHIPEALHSKNVQVEWLLPHSLNTLYTLNENVGNWEFKGEVLSKEDYAKVKQDFSRLRGNVYSTT